MFKFFEKGPVNSPEEEARLKEIRDARAREAALTHEERVNELKEQLGEDESVDESNKKPETLH